MRWMCTPCEVELEFADLAEVSAHFEGHGYEVDRRPDGGPVVVDPTLEPQEFEGSDRRVQ